MYKLFSSTESINLVYTHTATPPKPDWKQVPNVCAGFLALWTRTFPRSPWMIQMRNKWNKYGEVVSQRKTRSIMQPFSDVLRYYSFSFMSFPAVGLITYAIVTVPFSRRDWRLSRDLVHLARTELVEAAGLF